MRKSFAAVFWLFFTAVLFASSVYAEVTTDFGGALRLRQEYWDNVQSLGTGGPGKVKPDRDFFRFRLQGWGKVTLNKDTAIYGRLVTEPKYYIGSRLFRPNSGNTPPNNDRLDENELNVDNLYLDTKNVLGLPLDVRIGRQDFLGPDMYGEGFIFLDGTPGDGSRTFYFNAARARVRFGQNNSVDLLYISDDASDTTMPSLHPSEVGPSYADHKIRLTTSREKAFAVYGRTKPFGGLAFEPYYVYKTESAYNDPVTNAFTPFLHLNTIGGRVVYSFGGGWQVGGEYAHQFGKYTDGTSRTGNGGYAFVSRKYESVKWKPEWDLRYVYLSGDNPNTSNKVEAWDPLFSRAPYWNELIIYSLPSETANYGKNLSSNVMPGYWTNMRIYKAGVKLNFSPNTNLGVAYQFLQADKATSGLSTAMFSNSGKDRGHLPTALLYHRFSKKVDGFLQYEHFTPENYYSSNAQDATFFRWQLQIML
ncbi:MAG TPA: alginate export family protein [Dissulfurispiraceae bacterium]